MQVGVHFGWEERECLFCIMRAYSCISSHIPLTMPPHHDNRHKDLVVIRSRPGVASSTQSPLCHHLGARPWHQSPPWTFSRANDLHHPSGPLPRVETCTWGWAQHHWTCKLIKAVRRQCKTIVQRGICMSSPKTLSSSPVYKNDSASLFFLHSQRC
jgi:hypothetical protein